MEESSSYFIIVMASFGNEIIERVERKYKSSAPYKVQSGEILTSSCLSIPPLSCSRFKRHLVFFPVIISSSEPLYQLSIHLWPSPQPPDVLELHARKKETGDEGEEEGVNHTRTISKYHQQPSRTGVFLSSLISQRVEGQFFTLTEKSRLKVLSLKKTQLQTNKTYFMPKTKICCRHKL